MKSFKWLITTTLLAACTLIPTVSASADELGRGMVVNSAQMGTAYVYMTNTGACIVLPKSGAKIVMRSPKWDVVTYNDKSKLIFITAMDALKNRRQRLAAQSSQMANKAASAVRKGTTGTIAGMKATQYFVQNDGRNGPTMIETWITHEFAPPEELKVIFGPFFQVDSQKYPPGMPLRVIAHSANGRTDQLFDTTQCQAQRINPASFSYPTNYQPARDQLSVLMDDAARRRMESVFEDESLDSLANSPTVRARERSAQLYRQPAGVGRGQAASARTSSQQAAGAGAKSSDWLGNILDNLEKKK